ncbi:uncharacterized protein [Coffea arabica]|uniref:RNA-directed DNA polymerase n=1 Tax=Coffea arabica TaxID=13443 RepID=A0ABM4W4B4_COFAR
MEQKFETLSSMMKALLTKEKSSTEKDKTGRDRTPLLPTPPIHQRLNLVADEEAKSCEFLDKIPSHNLPKLELHMFNGEKPYEWVKKCNKYFMLNKIPEDHKLLVVEMFLEGKADNWFQGIKLEKPKLTLWRFKGTCCRNIVEEFNMLQQISTEEIYQERFEELRTLMLFQNPNLSEVYFISNFTSGLKEKIKPMVKMLKPNTLSGVIEVAHLQEQALRLQGKTMKEGNKVVAEPRFGMYRHPTSTNGGSDALGEQDELTNNPREPVEILLNALSDSLGRNTILLQGQLAGETVKILVDTGSSDSYIHHMLVLAQGIPFEYVKPFTVTIGMGVWIMELGDWDLILGVDWMCNYNPITFDFHQLNFYIPLGRGQVTTEGQRVPELITTVLEQFPKVFQEPAQLPPNRRLDHQIPLKPRGQAFKMKPYRYPHSPKIEIERQITNMLKSRIIKPSNSPYASPVQLVKKKDNTWHFCVDYRHLNDLTVNDRYPIPNIDKLLDELYGARFFSKIDLRSGYHQIRVKMEDTYKTAFQTHQDSHKAFNHLQQAISSAPMLRLLNFDILFTVETDAVDKALVFRKMENYLVGNHFIIRTDHKSLKFLLEQRLTTTAQYKWLTKLLGLDYEIQYKKDSEIQLLMFYPEEPLLNFNLSSCN